MKLKTFIAAFVAVLLCTSCGILGTSAVSDNAPLTSSNGSSVGSALLSLYTQYRKDGKIDLSRIDNILNIATIANNVKGIKTTPDTASFVQGLINGSSKLVTASNSAAVLSQLGKLSNLDLNSITAAAAQGTAGAAQLANQIDEKSKSVNSALLTLTDIFKTVSK